MKRCGWLGIVCLSLLAPAWAQWGLPHLGYAYPAGGQQGTTVQVLVGGQFLAQPQAVLLSGAGVQATVVDYLRPLNDGDLRDISWFLDNLVRRRWSATFMDATRKLDDVPELPDHPWVRDLEEKTPAELAALRARLFNPRKQLNPQLADQVLVAVTVAPNAPPGDRELRLLTPSGLSNPVCFQIGALPEAQEQEGAAVLTPQAVPVVLNGQILPGDVDRFALRLRQGQQLVVRAQARHLVPYLADAVPGWFQATVALFDAAGREVAFDDDYRFDPDPVLLYQVPADGVYQLEVRDAIYRGRDDFVSRVAVGELPFVTGMFPLGGHVGAPLKVTLTGWHLPFQTLDLDTSPGGERVRFADVPALGGLCGRLPYLVDDWPEVADAEPNDTAPEAQAVTLPLDVNGRIGQPEDVDTYRFTGRANEEIVAEVYARRLNSPLDGVLRLVNAGGKLIAENDDHPDPEMGFLTHLADPYLAVKLPQDGEYRLLVSDAQRQGGSAYGYRLRLGPPQPDFAVRITPSSAGLRPGGTANLTAQVVRKDGFAGDVDVLLAEPPAGITLRGGRVPAGKASAALTLSVPRGLTDQVLSLRFEARALIAGATVSHRAVPAEDMMQAFAYRHLVPQQEFVLALPGPRPVPAVWRPLATGLQVATATPVAVPLGSTAVVTVTGATDKQRFTLAAAPPGVRLKQTVPVPGGVGLVVKADANLAHEGESGNLIISVSGPAGAASVLAPVALHVVQP